MTPGKNSPQKSQRSTTVNWKVGDTRALLRAPGCRAPEEIAASKKKAAEERKSKEQAIKANEKKTARDVHAAAQLEDALVKESEEAEGAFPHSRGGMFN